MSSLTLLTAAASGTGWPSLALSAGSAVGSAVIVIVIAWFRSRFSQKATKDLAELSTALQTIPQGDERTGAEKTLMKAVEASSRRIMIKETPIVGRGAAGLSLIVAAAGLVLVNFALVVTVLAGSEVPSVVIIVLSVLAGILLVLGTILYVLWFNNQFNHTSE